MSSDSLILIFQPDNPCNTTITNQATEETLYVVSTTHDGPTVTIISNAEDQIIASWQWRDVRSDMVTMGSGTPVSSSAWLKKSIIPFINTVSFTDPAKRKFKWKGNGAGLAYELNSRRSPSKPTRNSYFRDVLQCSN